jgi:hypothetical protein
VQINEKLEIGQRKILNQAIFLPKMIVTALENEMDFLCTVRQGYG